MSSVPLHPAIVHVPLGLAFILPVLAAGFAWALWTARISARGWLIVVALQAMLVAGGLVALNTGEREEERVEKVVPGSAISTHEEYAEQFVWGAAATFIVSALVPVLRRRELARVVTVASVAGTMAVAVLAVRVGHAGGQLVYKHNAGSAYASATVTSRAAPSPTVAAPDRDDDDR